MVGYTVHPKQRPFVARRRPMMSRDERLRYWEKIEAAQAALLADPEVAVEYELASRAWDSTIVPSPVEVRSSSSKGPGPSKGPCP